MLNEHYYCKVEEEEVVAVNTQPVTNTVSEPVASVAVEEDTTESDIDDLLKDL